MKKRIALLILLALVILIALYFIFLQKPKCNTLECFQEHMKKCSRASYINEEPEASWKYEIINPKNEQCYIKVTMLQAKQGELKIEVLNGLSMTCFYPIGTIAFPEKSLDNCSGKLKEELQSIIINKLHAYIIENLGSLDEALRSAV